jgi:hypothetical protein
MNKTQTKEFLQAMWCALNCATTNEEVMKIMNLAEKYGGSAMPKWQSYITKKQGIFETSLKEMEQLLKS